MQFGLPAVSDAERTHKATPKRVKEFRKRGEIALSRDLVSALTLGGGVIALLACAGTAGAALIELTRKAAGATDGRDVSWLPSAALHSFLAAVAPVLIGAAVAALLAILGQLGWPPAFKSIGFDLARMSPLTNLRETFGLKSMTRRAGGALAKLVVVGAVVGAFALRGAISAEELEAGAFATKVWSIAARALWAVLGVLIALAAVDYVLARRRIGSKMKMSSEEIKREHKESEGDPMLRGRRRQRMRELAKRRMPAAVAKADVIVVNPTHYAVALRYQDGVDRAPMVVAKGTDEVAEKIREIARKHGVPVVPRPPLARALFKHVKENQAIPANLYRAVAEVLAYVYRLKRGNA